MKSVFNATLLVALFSTAALLSGCDQKSDQAHHIKVGVINCATDKGELDANVFQHRPYLAEQNKAYGYKLVRQYLCFPNGGLL